MAILDIVNEQDEVIGSAPYEEIKTKQLLCRGVCILAFDAQKRLYVQRRAKKNVVAPGLWDMSASGHVDLGESYEVAASRELKEELGLHGAKLRFVTKYYDEEPNLQYGLMKGFVELFEAHIDNQIVTPNTAELMDGKWVTITELEEWLRQSPGDFTEGAQVAYNKYKEAA